ncbi:6954_t:CDS:2 [Paraglomus brasilianum]|uniref:6954_t:CDS:1 n=1 Tax=Paraglomus brasilianum TaxID=144538 RepID=A0A9N8W732_9GLOM|nr:6954_t:CDS:2 [Paraglomus brasilianum]
MPQDESRGSLVAPIFPLISLSESGGSTPVPKAEDERRSDTNFCLIPTLAEWEEGKKPEIQTGASLGAHRDSAIKTVENHFSFPCYRNSSNGQKKGDPGIEIMKSGCGKKKTIPRLDRLRARLQLKSLSQNNFTAVGKNIEI